MKEHLSYRGEVDTNLVATKNIYGIDWHVISPKVGMLVLKGGVENPQERKKGRPRMRSGLVRPYGPRIPEVKRGGHSDFLSRGLSYNSNGGDAEGLDFWVRNGTRYTPSL